MKVSEEGFTIYTYTLQVHMYADWIVGKSFMFEYIYLQEINLCVHIDDKMCIRYMMYSRFNILLMRCAKT